MKIGQFGGKLFVGHNRLYEFLKVEEEKVDYLTTPSVSQTA
jgi:hypothetical protein